MLRVCACGCGAEFEAKPQPRPRQFLSASHGASVAPKHGSTALAKSCAIDVRATSAEIEAVVGELSELNRHAQVALAAGDYGTIASLRARRVSLQAKLDGPDGLYAKRRRQRYELQRSWRSLLPAAQVARLEKRAFTMLNRRRGTEDIMSQRDLLQEMVVCRGRQRAGTSYHRAFTVPPSTTRPRPSRSITPTRCCRSCGSSGRSSMTCWSWRREQQSQKPRCRLARRRARQRARTPSQARMLRALDVHEPRRVRVAVARNDRRRLQCVRHERSHRDERGGGRWLPRG